MNFLDIENGRSSALRLTETEIILQSESLPLSYCTRVTHEGFSFSHLFGVALSPLVVQWSEISALVPYTRIYLGRPVASLGIVPHDPEAIVARIIQDKSVSFFSHFLMKVNIYFYQRSKALSPLNIPSVILPVSIDELIELIQERFASELNTHCIAVQGWQTV